MKFYQFAHNLYISDDPQFGDYNHEIVYDLLKSIDINFSSCLNTIPFSTCNCLITYKEEGPECCKLSFGHIIFLSSTENYWGQWVYQFSHEYCHHLIDGKLSGDVHGLMWFEESICHLSSMYQLYLLYTQWNKNSNSIKSRFAPCLQYHLNVLLNKNQQLSSSTDHSGWLQSWIPLLSEPQYHRDHYNVIATKMYPLFVRNPNLWKIILHFGDMRNWNSLSDLFEHLHQTADDSYSKSLSDLEKLLLS